MKKNYVKCLKKDKKRSNVNGKIWHKSVVHVLNKTLQDFSLKHGSIRKFQHGHKRGRSIVYKPRHLNFDNNLMLQCHTCNCFLTAADFIWDIIICRKWIRGHILSKKYDLLSFHMSLQKRFCWHCCLFLDFLTTADFLGNEFPCHWQNMTSWYNCRLRSWLSVQGGQKITSHCLKWKKVMLFISTWNYLRCLFYAKPLGR